MSSLAELARAYASLSAGEVAHLQRLVASWGLAADLCFADLLMYVPADDVPSTDPARYVVAGQVRPATSQTLYPHDLVGTLFPAEKRPVIHRAYRSGEIQTAASPPRVELDEPVRVLAVPVRCAGRVIAVVARESTPSIGRRHGELENAYLEAFDRLARMITLGEFPFPEEETSGEELPRLGDGALLVDGDGRIRYASPNANSAAHRLGVLSDMAGRTLGELGIDDTVWRQAGQVLVPTTTELTSGDSAVLAYAVPLLERRRVVGGLLLLRDISELRRLDRLLVSKDTHIREIHHRVKNNLQTISALLRIQSRRLTSEEARLAIEESVRRIGSIALVHETLSREASEDVPFAEIARPLMRMVEESLVSPERPVRFGLVGDTISLPAAVATPLALVLTELLQNAVGHAFAEGGEEGAAAGQVDIELQLGEDQLAVAVRDNGAGLPPGFDLDHSPGLGLSIVRTLVNSELGGSMRMRDRRDDGAEGTLIELRIPLRDVHAPS